MGAESLNNSNRDSLGYKLRKGAVATVAVVSSLGFAQGASSQEVSSHPPTALQFFKHEFARLNEVAAGIKESDHLASIEISKWDTGSAGYLGYETNIVSKDKSTWYQIICNSQKSANWSIFSLDVYTGNPKVKPNAGGITNSLQYEFQLLRDNNGKDLLFENTFGNLIPIKTKYPAINSGAFVNIKKNLPKVNSKSTFTPVQMFEVNTLVDQAIEVIKCGGKGDVARTSTIVTGSVETVETRLFPPK